MKVYPDGEAAERIFFISAKEALQARMQEQCGQPAHSKYIKFQLTYISNCTLIELIFYFFKNRWCTS